MASRDHGPVLEPEVEQVSVDEQRLAQIGDGREKAVEGGLDRGGDLSQMGVGDDEHTGGHGPQARSGPGAPQARMLYFARRDQHDYAARQLFRNRSDGRGLSRQLSDLVRPRTYRADARDWRHLQRAGAAGRLPRRFGGEGPLPRRGALRRLGARALLG